MSSGENIPQEMTAAYIKRFKRGGTVFVGPRPVPKPAEDEVLIRVYSAALNPVDWKIRDGLLKPIFQRPMPLTLGCDVSGVVAAVGSECKNIKVGEEVFGDGFYNSSGTLAEYATLKEKAVALKPRSVSHKEACCFPLAGLTTMQIFDAMQDKRPRKVFLSGGTGGVGCFATQYASRVIGADVTVTCSSLKSDLCKELGAKECVDYHKDKFWEKLPSRSFDAAIDTTGEAEHMLTLVKEQGSVVSIIVAPNAEEIDWTMKEDNGHWAFSNWITKRVLNYSSRGIHNAAHHNNVHFKYVLANPYRTDMLRDISKMVDDGKVRAVIDKEYPLSQARDALAYQEQGHCTGKVVINVHSD